MSDGRDTRGADTMRQSASAAGNAGKSAGKMATRGAKKLNHIIPLKYKVIIAVGIALFMLVYAAVVQGTSESSMDKTANLTANGAEKVLAPEDEEELSSVYTREQSLNQTVELAKIIEETKRKDRERVEQELRTTYADRELTIECDSDSMPTFVCDDVDGYGTPYASAGGATSGTSFQQAVVKWVRDIVAMNYYRYKVWTGAGGPNDHPTHMCPLCHPGTGDG